MFNVRTLARRLAPGATRAAVAPPAADAPRRPDQPGAAEAAFQAFRRDYPAYDATRALDRLRATEYARLDRQGQVYLDYTGGGLYAESQLRDHLALLDSRVFGNPHSKNLTSLAMTELVEQAREYVLRYFNAAPDEYMAIFTPNASGALKLIGEAYPFAPGDHYLLTFDNHNSVNGIREFARAAGATVTYLPVEAPDLRVAPDALEHGLALARPGARNLFAYPAQSNFTGVQHPLEWIAEAQARGWDVLLDAAAFAPTNQLDLGRWHPDFVSLSFYKMFGYPTGIGCLLARKDAAGRLRRPWYAGGTITFSSVVAFGHYLTPGPAGFEDGTVNYLGLPAVELGLKHLEAIGIETIHTRVQCLAGWLITQLVALRHGNGRPVVRLYGPADTDRRGGTVQVNFFDPEGRMIDCVDVERLANGARISLRAGCHCNPGAREIALGFTRDDLIGCFRDQESLAFEQFLRVIEGKTTGALRASLGLASTFADVYAYVQFAETFVDRPAHAV
ncbi:MAG TPA: aminotransferase class V-fold PLP-dependent enzyme [Thermomicrobiales bacterium]|nr:aminotransferase class V-fold PLP-dependent enzyme [Thermomicrobiales bacterium]